MEMSLQMERIKSESEGSANHCWPLSTPLGPHSIPSPNQVIPGGGQAWDHYSRDNSISYALSYIYHGLVQECIISITK